MADIRKKHDSAWLVRWREGGKQRYRQFRTEAEAVAYKEQVESAARTRRVLADVPGLPGWGGRALAAADARWSVTEYAKLMIDTQDLRDSTKFTYLRAVRLYLEPFDLGREDVRTIGPEQINRWWIELGKRGAGQQDAQRLLSKVLRRAVRVGDREDNPLLRTDVRKPRHKREEDFDPLTAEQIEQLADAAAAPREKGYRGRAGDMVRRRDRLMILVMGFAGLRAGEVGGLRKQDMIKTPEGRCQLRIRQQVVKDAPRTAPRLAPPKTPAARRTITIACSLWEEIWAFVDEYAPAPDGRIFHGPNGEMRTHADMNNAVTAAARRLGMAGVHSHLLRHSAVSLLIHARANPRQIQAFVGHADISMTLGTYGHLFDQSGTELADVMEGLREQYRNGS